MIIKSELLFERAGYKITNLRLVNTHYESYRKTTKEVLPVKKNHLKNLEKHGLEIHDGEIYYTDINKVINAINGYNEGSNGRIFLTSWGGPLLLPDFCRRRIVVKANENSCFDFLLDTVSMTRFSFYIQERFSEISSLNRKEVPPGFVSKALKDLEPILGIKVWHDCVDFSEEVRGFTKPLGTIIREGLKFLLTRNDNVTLQKILEMGTNDNYLNISRIPISKEHYWFAKKNLANPRCLSQTEFWKIISQQFDRREHANKS